jgi:hypothetical protein
MVTNTIKKVVFILGVIIFGFLQSSYAQFVRSPFDNEKINGNITWVADIDYSVRSNGAIDTTISMIKYDEHGSAIEQHVSTRYDNRFIKPDTMNNQSHDQNYHSYFTYYKDDQGHNLKMVFRRGANKHVYLYNKKGLAKSSTVYDSDNNVLQEMTKNYDNNGNMLKIEIYVPRTNSRRSQEYKYDSNNRAVQEIYFSAGYSDKSHIEYSNFDNMHNWRKCVRTNEEGRKFVSYRQIKYRDEVSK